MRKFIVEYYKNKQNITKDDILIEIGIYLISVFSALIFSFLYIVLSLNFNYLLILILDMLIFGYNKEMIFEDIFSEFKKSLIKNKQARRKVIFFTIAKYNLVIIPIYVALVLSSLIIMMQNYKSGIVLFANCLGIFIYYYISYIIMKHKKRRNIYKSTKYSLFKIYDFCLLFFKRLSLSEYILIVFQFTVVIISEIFKVPSSVVMIVLCCLNTLNIEVYQDKLIQSPHTSINKELTLSHTKLNSFKKYLLSFEFKEFIIFMFLGLIILLFSGIRSIYVIFLFFAISYRYYHCFRVMMLNRKRVSPTIFRLIIFYLASAIIIPKELIEVLPQFKSDIVSIVTIICQYLLISIMIILPIEKLLVKTGIKLNEEV